MGEHIINRNQDTHTKRDAHVLVVGPYTKAAASLQTFPWMGPKSTAKFHTDCAFFYMPSKSRHETHLLLAHRLAGSSKPQIRDPWVSSPGL